jgi:hypothetical protein
MDINLETQATVSPDVLVQEIGGESVLLDLKSEKYFGLDAVGTRIWRLLEVNGRLGALHSALLSEYDVDAACLEKDLCELVARLAESGLVNIKVLNAKET